MALGQEEIGRRVREAREGADLTQQELADSIGIKQGQTISNYERGITEISAKRLRRIAEATNRPLAFFVHDEAEVTPPVLVSEEVAQVLERLDRIEEHLRQLREG